MVKKSSSSHILFAVLAVVGGIMLWRWYTAPKKYTDAAMVDTTRKPVLGAVPNGTPMRLADAMRLSVDDTFPRLGDTTVKVIHGDGEPRQFVQEVVDRLNRNGAKVAPLAVEAAQFAKLVDSTGISRFDLKFLVYDQTVSKPGYPSEQVVKLAATFLQGPQDKPRLYSLNFATPRDPLGGPEPLDTRAPAFARFETPLEVLQSMDLSPGADVQT